MKTPVELFMDRRTSEIKPPKRKFKRRVLWRCSLLELRTKYKMSLRDLERETGISNTTVSAAEHGNDLTLSNAKTIAEFFGVKVDDVWSRINPSEGQEETENGKVK